MYDADLDDALRGERCCVVQASAQFVASNRHQMDCAGEDRRRRTACALTDGVVAKAGQHATEGQS